MMRIYLDSCCYNRPFDDLSQERIHLESEAILSILQKGFNGDYELIGSDAVEYELYQINDLVKRQNVLDLYNNVESCIEVTDAIEARAEEIRSQSNIRYFDSLQVACAEASGADFMLTTDDKLEKMSTRLVLKIRIMNPSRFVIETIYGR